MRAPNTCKLEKVASRDQTRPVLANAHLRVEGEGENRTGYLDATNSYIAVTVPVEVDEADTTGPIPVDALKAARKGSGGMTANGDVAIDGGPRFTRRSVDEAGAFPNLPSLYPEDEAVLEIGISAKQLAALAEGMGADAVVLRIVGPTRVVSVTPHYSSTKAPKGSRGLIMPMRVD